MTKQDYTGQKFGKWTLIKEVEKSKSNYRQYLCRCECGTERVIKLTYLLNGKSKSCGCIKRLKIIPGQRFGRLVVLKLEGKNNSGSLIWLCKCDCGNEVLVRGHLLISGLTNSCGCLKKEYFGGTEQRTDCDKYVSYLNSKTPKTNKSGYKGVYWHKRSKKWIARIKFERKQIHLGCFENIEDAIKARKEAEEKYHKPYIDKYK